MKTLTPRNPHTARTSVPLRKRAIATTLRKRINCSLPYSVSLSSVTCKACIASGVIFTP